MNKHVILVGGYSMDDIYRTFAECHAMLIKKGIPIIGGCMARHYIETPRCVVHFINNASVNTLWGRRGDICFHIADALRPYIHCSRDGSTYSGDFIDYICEVEEVKEENADG